jgi:hypothetical protein
MARPPKEGLIYFPLDVDMADDDKVILIQAQHGVTGFGILIRLLMELYKNGYYYAWTEREQLIFSNRINVDLKTIREVVNDALKWGFFHQKLYDQYRILTSRGIQKRYLEGTSRRKEVHLIREYLLLEPPKRDNLVITGFNAELPVETPAESALHDRGNGEPPAKFATQEIVHGEQPVEPPGVNAGKNPVNADINKQSKVNESTVNESTVQKNTVLKDHVCSGKPETHGTDNVETPVKPGKNNYPAEFEAFWQAYPRLRRKEKRAAFKAWQARLKQGKPQGLTVDKLIAAAEHYAAEMEALQREPKYIKLPKTFLGSNCPFEDYIKPPQKQGLDSPRAWVKLKKYINPKEVFSHDHG